ncbi:MAG TPA: hypothetical protein VHL11_02175 [Phototrophicaceae bacterium]|jgi:hypothetical protein|nr:hypothetical protein [Phototrophicaceae bacterium]
MANKPTPQGAKRLFQILRYIVLGVVLLLQAIALKANPTVEAVWKVLLTFSQFLRG